MIQCVHFSVSAPLLPDVEDFRNVKTEADVLPRTKDFTLYIIIYINIDIFLSLYIELCI